MFRIVFSVGLRPFFLLAGLSGALSMLAWLCWLDGDTALLGFGPGAAAGISAVAWHGHEMIFGFAAAVICGFMLTAIPNWTASQPLSGAPLAALAALWLAGRVVMWLPGLVPPVLAALVDLAFLPALAGCAAVPLIRARALRNMIFLVLLAVLFAANSMFHLEATGLVAGDDLARTGILLGVNLIVLLITIVGGRIIPAFTGNWLRANGIDAPIRPAGRLDVLTIAATALFLIAELALPGSRTVGGIALIACLLHLARMTGWQGHRTLGSPIMWVLHLGYSWLVVGFALKAAALLTGALPPSAAMHALTAGAVGTMTLAVMSRAALGHTGRQLRVAPAIAVAYLLVSLATLGRVAGSMLLPDTGAVPMLVSGALWTLAFAIFTVIYTPILLRPAAEEQG